MTLEVLKALTVILEFCLEQDSCKNYPMAQFCQKMPCHVNGKCFFGFCEKAAAPVWSRFFARLGQQNL